METFRTYCSIDAYGRLNVLSSTQIVFHTRRIIANALHIPKSMIRVDKPRIGGGFGAKQTAVSAVYPAFVTWMTKKPSKIIYQPCRERRPRSSPRHEMEMHVRLGRERRTASCAASTSIRCPIRALTASTARQRSACPVISPFRCYGRAEAFRFTQRRCVYEHHVCGRVPRLRRDAGPVRGRDAR